MIVKESEIRKLSPPNGKPDWDENDIRMFQESKGINYGATVYERGVKPNRMWTNVRDDYDNVPVKQVIVEKTENEKLKEEIERLNAELEIRLATGSHSNVIDKRTKAYKESIKA